jgi:uncharacterized protein (UPF0335 family)
MEITKIDEATTEKLRQLISKIERLVDEKKQVSEDINSVYGEAKALGYDTKAIKEVIKLRAIDKAKREEQEMILETYLIALGEV